MTVFSGRRNFPVCPPGFASVDEVHIPLVRESVARMRELIQLPASDLPCPRLVTHVNYHADEAWGLLLARAVHADDEPLEFTYELVQRDKALSFSLHPQIHNAWVLGLGGEESVSTGSSTEVFNEYVAGVRTDKSTSQLVIDRSVRPVAGNLSVIDPISKEIDRIDAHGDKSGGEHHLARLIKGLHQINTLTDGNLGRITAAHKEAVMLACLSSVAKMLGTGDLSPSKSATSEAVLASWGRYKAEAAWVFGSDTAVARTEEILSRHHAGTGILSLRNTAFALQQTLEETLADYVLHTIFESLVQLQYDFEQALADAPHIKRFHRGGQQFPITLEWYKTRYEEKMPHRARLYHYNNVAEGWAILVVHNPFIMNTTIFPNKFLAFDKQYQGIWEKFVAAVMEREPDQWHATKNADTGVTGFLLNGSATHQEVPPTALLPKDFADILGSVIPTPNPARPGGKP